MTEVNSAQNFEAANNTCKERCRIEFHECYRFAYDEDLWCDEDWHYCIDECSKRNISVAKQDIPV